MVRLSRSFRQRGPDPRYFGHDSGNLARLDLVDDAQAAQDLHCDQILRARREVIQPQLAAMVLPGRPCDLVHPGRRRPAIDSRSRMGRGVAEAPGVVAPPFERAVFEVVAAALGLGDRLEKSRDIRMGQVRGVRFQQSPAFCVGHDSSQRKLASAGAVAGLLNPS